MEQNDSIDSGALQERYRQAKARRSAWEGLWHDCYDYALPRRDGFSGHSAGSRKGEHLYDATAMDAADQLAASLLGNLTPPWTQWFGFKAGPDLSPEEAESLSPLLEKTARIMQAHFDRSNFAVEMHQAFLDLVVGGTASLYFEEADPGELSAFKFTAVPLNELVLEEGRDGRLDGTYCVSAMTYESLSHRYPEADYPMQLLQEAKRDPQQKFDVLETVLPDETAYRYVASLLMGSSSILSTGRFHSSPFISFRWMKSPGELYGRSPVMKALPDIKTANKVVELILKNASIAVTGIWQADDDGVLNPANIDLTPGSIIPKAIGSKGLTPLDMPGRFDVSELVLDSLRKRIRHALLADRLGQIGDRRMTATEVLERSAEMALVLGATYGRLQSELLTPLIKRAFTILKRRGEIPDIALDGRLVELDYRSPLARAQAQRNVQNTLSWVQSVLSMGGEAAKAIDLPQTARYLGQALGVPGDLIRNEITPPSTIQPVLEEQKTDAIRDNL